MTEHYETVQNTNGMVDITGRLVAAVTADNTDQLGRTTNELAHRSLDCWEFLETKNNPEQKQLNDFGFVGYTVDVRR